jgi:phosphorylcholine metabolism protein LicD
MTDPSLLKFELMHTFLLEKLFMKRLSLRVYDGIYEEAEKIIAALHIPRDAYINQALALYNQYNKRKILKHKLKKESVVVFQESMTILKEFEHLETPHGY